MGTLTPEMDAEIKARYAVIKSYKSVAAELGLNWKTVKVHVTKNSQNRGENAASPSRENVATQPEQDRSQEQDRQQLTQSHLSQITEQEHPFPLQEENRLQKGRDKSPFFRALRLFERGKTPVQAAVELDLTFGDVEQYYAQYGRLCRVARFFEICQGSPATLGAILKLHEKMLKADLDPSKTVQQLQYLGPIERASVTYQRLKEHNQNLQVEIQEREKKNANVALAAGQLKAQVETLQKDIVASRGQLNALENQCRERKAALIPLQASESRISTQIKSARATLNELTAENWPIQTRIREDAEEKAYEVLNDNELVLGTCVAAAMSVMMQDPMLFLDFHNQYPVRQGEDTTTFIQRCIPFLKEKFELMFNQVRNEFAREVSNTAAVARGYHS